MLTIARKISTASSLNRHGFCLLSGIPHVWLRAQTIRCTEQFVALNTHNSPIGATTRERLCSMVPKPNVSPPEVFAILNQRKLRNRRHNRLSGTLKFLQSLGAQIKGKQCWKNGRFGETCRRIEVNSPKGRGQRKGTYIYRRIHGSTRKRL
jgi:hypothetical protein